jgi:hypothetical protein
VAAVRVKNRDEKLYLTMLDGLDGCAVDHPIQTRFYAQGGV